MSKPYNKILVFGNSGSGKTTLSKHISDISNIEHFEIDDFRWADKWLRRDDKIFKEDLNDIKDKEKWIVEDGSKNTLHSFAEEADVIIVIDVNVFICLFRLIRRSIFRWFGQGDRGGEPIIMALKHWRHCLKYKYLSRGKKYMDYLNSIDRELIVIKSNLERKLFIEHMEKKYG